MIMCPSEPTRFRATPAIWVLVLAGFVAGARLSGQSAGGASMPKVVVPGAHYAATDVAVTSSVPSRFSKLYPWKTYITCTVFWIGEEATLVNTTPNHKSSWDQQWVSNYGGFDDPDPCQRIANHESGEFRPKAFVPRQNPFYVALPYNDRINAKEYKPEASRVIPWFWQSAAKTRENQSVCKGRWIQVYHGGRSCFAQWEDCGPWETDDWQYVFGGNPPKTTRNDSAGIDISPSVRDYLRIKSGQKVHWRFVDDSQVPFGPWKKFIPAPVQSPVPALAANSSVPAKPAVSANQRQADREYMERLRQLRDEQFLKKPIKQSTSW